MKKRITATVILAVIFAAVLAVFMIFALPKINEEIPAETTETKELIAGEVQGAAGRIQMFEHIKTADIAGIYVNNSYGNYRVVRKDGSLVIEGAEKILLDSEKLTQMVVNAGYTLSTYSSKVNEADFAKYGLADDQSECYFVITSTAGKRYTVYIGDKIPSGGGYYARYEGRDAVYVLDLGIEKDLLAPVTALVRPLLAYPSQLNSYYLMQSFMLYRGEDLFLSAEYLNPDRRSELAAMSVHRITYPGEYAAGTYYDGVLSLFCNFSGTETVSISVSDEERAKYGLSKPAYTLYAVNTAVDDKGNPTNLIENYLVFSEKQRDDKGNYFYYVASATFGIIARVEENTVDFLSWELEKWVSPNLFQVNIVNAASIAIKAKDIDDKFTFGGDSNDTLTVTSREVGKIADVKNFRQLWKVLIYMSAEGSVKLPEADREAILADDNCMLEIDVVTKSGIERNFRFYPYSDRRVYCTINGVGEFYVNRSMLEKIIADAVRAQKGEPINAEVLY